MALGPPWPGAEEGDVNAYNLTAKDLRAREDVG